uniref:Uncharacterized protein n=1 Tax=Glossina palpalis gambiensis TaxID=67801 RepID=A0A1B0C575_9MUSC
MPRHHNVIRKVLAVIKDDFSTVCSWVQFNNVEDWLYDLCLAKNPAPVRCPVAGKFNFTQRGEHPFKTRILGGVTLSPRPLIYCKENISDLSVCDTDQKELAVDENYSLSRLRNDIDLMEAEEKIRNRELDLLGQNAKSTDEHKQSLSERFHNDIKRLWEEQKLLDADLKKLSAIDLKESKKIANIPSDYLNAVEDKLQQYQEEFANIVKDN